MNISNIYGIAAGVILLLVGIVLLFLKKLDTMLVNSESTDKDIRRSRLILSILAIIGGLISLSAVLLGWPPIKGYIIPPLNGRNISHTFPKISFDCRYN